MKKRITISLTMGLMLAIASSLFAQVTNGVTTPMENRIDAELICPATRPSPSAIS